MMLSKWNSDVNYVKMQCMFFTVYPNFCEQKNAQTFYASGVPIFSSARLHIVRWEVFPLNVGLQLASVARKRLPSYRTSTIVQKCQLFGNKHLTIHKHWRDKQSDACQNFFFCSVPPDVGRKDCKIEVYTSTQYAWIHINKLILYLACILYIAYLKKLFVGNGKVV